MLRFLYDIKQRSPTFAKIYKSNLVVYYSKVINAFRAFQSIDRTPSLLSCRIMCLRVYHIRKATQLHTKNYPTARNMFGLRTLFTIATFLYMTTDMQLFILLVFLYGILVSIHILTSPASFCIKFPTKNELASIVQSYGDRSATNTRL